MCCGTSRFWKGKAMNTRVLQDVQVNPQASLVWEAPKPDIADDATIVFNGLTVNGEILQELTVSQAAKVLGVNEEKVVHLIADHTLCCVRTDENNAPILDAACVRAQAGLSKRRFVEEVRRIISAEKDSAERSSTEKSSLESNSEEKRSIGSPASTEKAFEELFVDSFLTGADIGESVDSVVVPENELVGPTDFDRRAITSKSLHALLASFETTSARLEAAMYRAGYLESQVNSLQEQLLVLPDLRTKAAQTLILQRENEQLKATVAKHETELLEVHQRMDRLRQSWWWRAWCWALGVKL